MVFCGFSMVSNGLPLVFPCFPMVLQLHVQSTSAMNELTNHDVTPGTAIAKQRG